MKTVTIISCHKCPFFDDNWGARCFHPDVTTPLPHGDGVIPKPLTTGSWPTYPIPDWCPLPETEVVSQLQVKHSQDDGGISTYP